MLQDENEQEPNPSTYTHNPEEDLERKPDRKKTRRQPVLLIALLKRMSSPVGEAALALGVDIMDTELALQLL